MVNEFAYRHEGISVGLQGFDDAGKRLGGVQRRVVEEHYRAGLHALGDTAVYL